MSSRPTGPDSGLQRLLDEGYQVEVRDQHLLLHAVPYATSNQVVATGTLVCTYIENAGSVLPPDNHQVWWTGEYPCFSNGRPIDQIRNEDGQRELFPGLLIRHRFSNKPVGVANFPDHYSKLRHYANLIQAQAKGIDPNADARGERKDVVATTTTGPFAYADSASARAEIQSTASRLALKRVAIVGVGGTGAYVLDQVAKTPVEEIHLFDGDVFLKHNAFRSPGAAAECDFAQRPNKADYFKRKYEVMHRGIFSHAYHVDAARVGELAGFDFVFLCVDRGSTRRLLYQHLMSESTPFIDVGMNLHLVSSTGTLVGSCRFTLCTPEQNAHFAQYAPMEDDDQDAIYRQNIQISDMNALNAQLAVIKWKQYFRFYQDDFNAFNGTFSVNSMSLVRDVLVPMK
ncbi:MAG: ThiF family adenylyltransferase [Betaproteobacteria bacterium]|nr:ThiF family adenylyltransferase [Betaproteobacteria bacterium]